MSWRVWAYVCLCVCLPSSGGVITPLPIRLFQPSSPSPPSLFIYPGLIQSSGRSVCRKGSLPRQPSVTEQCIRTLRHWLLRRKNQSTTLGRIRGREGHLSHLCDARWLQLFSRLAAVHTWLGLFVSLFFSPCFTPRSSGMAFKQIISFWKAIVVLKTFPSFLSFIGLVGDIHWLSSVSIAFICSFHLSSDGWSYGKQHPVDQTDLQRAQPLKLNMILECLQMNPFSQIWNGWGHASCCQVSTEVR